MVGRTKEDCPQGSTQACLTHTHTHTHAHTHTQHDHMQISTVSSTHIDVHADACIHTSAALRQRLPCLTTTSDLVKQKKEEGEKSSRRVERDTER